MAETSGSGRRKPSMARRAKPGTPYVNSIRIVIRYRRRPGSPCPLGNKISNPIGFHDSHARLSLKAATLSRLDRTSTSRISPSQSTARHKNKRRP